MCGIAGALSFGLPFFSHEELLRKFSLCLKNRGPDSKGYYFLNQEQFSVGLAHYRLSVIDLSPMANQPLFDSDKAVSIILNGEIYNFRELREILNKEGYRFQTQSDTEVLLAGYKLWGIEKILKEADGMFALAIFDLKERKMILARDRFGKKPLYYYHDPLQNRICFSSDIRSFNNLGISFTLDRHALGYYFTELSTPGKNTIWTQIKRVPEGSWLLFDETNFKISSYWQIQYCETTVIHSRGQLLENIEALLIDAVKKRLVADVNVGCLLSGGIDSSLITAIMAKVSAKQINTYSVGFNVDQYNELPYARKVSKMYDTNHHEIVLGAPELSVVNELIYEYGEPFADSSMIPTYYISKRISQNEKVVLSGDGGDEIFGGYYVYYLASSMDRVAELKPFFWFLQKIPSISHKIHFLKELISQFAKPDSTLLNRGLAFTPSSLKSLISDEIICSALQREHAEIMSEYTAQFNLFTTKVLAGSLKTRLLNDYLVKVDRASMYASLEVRSPYLDHKLAKAVGSVPRQELIKNGVTKSILKDIASKYIPHELLSRKKQGFSIPLAEWFRTDWKKDLVETLLDSTPSSLLINKEFLSTLLNEHMNGIDHSGELWSLYVFYKWEQQAKNENIIFS